jgi:hypothetical protein
MTNAGPLKANVEQGQADDREYSLLAPVPSGIREALREVFGAVAFTGPAADNWIPTLRCHTQQRCCSSGNRQPIHAGWI